MKQGPALCPGTVSGNIGGYTVAPPRDFATNGGPCHWQGPPFVARFGEIWRVPRGGDRVPPDVP